MTETDFIKSMIDTRNEVNIFLVNGIRLRSVIYYQDLKSIIVSNHTLTNKRMLIYKKSISTIAED